jgi:hypothetical protein
VSVGILATLVSPLPPSLHSGVFRGLVFRNINFVAFWIPNDIFSFSSRRRRTLAGLS